MLSRGLAIVKAAKLLQKNNNLHNNVRNSSHGVWHYRTASIPPNSDIRIAEVLQGFMWWWIFWHLWTQFDHVTGEFEYPNPSKWTDEELGIPPQ